MGRELDKWKTVEEEPEREK